MKPALPKIDPPPSCAAVRGRYSDLLQNQNFIRDMQTQIDDFGPYVQTQLEADLKEIEQTSNPQYIFKSFVKFVRLELQNTNDFDWLNFAQVTVFDDKGANISQNKTTSISSQWSTNTGAANAVNGRGEEMFNLVHSGYINGAVDTNAWWQVDLGNPSVVSRIVVQNRNDGARLRLAKYNLVLLNQQREVINRYPLNTNQTQTIEITLPSSKREIVNRKLNALKEAEAKMQESMKCMNLEINQRQSLSSDIYTLNQEAKTKEEDVKTKHENVKAAKERAELLQDPYNKTTVWEGWFPMGRPLEQGSIPVLWFLSIVFLSISFGLFLEMIGINIEIPGIKAFTDWIQSFFSGGSQKSGDAPSSDFVAGLFPKSKGNTGVA